MSILNTIKASPESKDYHLKDEREGEKEEKISLGTDKEYDSSEVATELEITRKLANLILKHCTYKTGANLKTKVLEAMNKSTRFSEEEAEKWEKEAKGLTKEWYNKGKIKYT